MPRLALAEMTRVFNMRSSKTTWDFFTCETHVLRSSASHEKFHM